MKCEHVKEIKWLPSSIKVIAIIATLIAAWYFAKFLDVI